MLHVLTPTHYQHHHHQQQQQWTLEQLPGPLRPCRCCCHQKGVCCQVELQQLNRWLHPQLLLMLLPPVDEALVLCPVAAAAAGPVGLQQAARHPHGLTRHHHAAQSQQMVTPALCQSSHSTLVTAL
jgi:hypothetical protein